MKWRGYDSITSWLVSVYCCIVFTLNLIPHRFIGLMYVSFLKHYETSREMASIPIVMYMVVNCVLSPFAGMIGQRVGIENMVIIGSFLAAAGIGGCYIARDIIGVSIFLGILYALGLSSSNTFLNSIIKKHFTRNFTTANGIIYSGSSILNVVIPPVTYFLLDLYSVDGAFLIVSGIMLHSLPVAILVRYASKMQAEIQKMHNSLSKGRNETSKLIPCAEMDSKKETEPDYTEELKTEDSNDFTIEYKTDSTEDKIEKQLQEDIQLRNSVIDSVSIPPAEKLEKVSDANNSKACSTGNEDEQLSVPLMATVPTTKEHLSVTVEKIALPQKSKSKLFNFNAFKEPMYILIMAINGINAYVCVLSWTTMLDYSRDKNISKQHEQYYLMFQPLSSFIGRLSLGWVIDKKYLSESTFLILCFLLMALSTVCMILAYNFELLMTGILGFGAFSGSTVAVFPVLIYKFVKEENQTVAQASQYSIFGIMIFTTTPLIGYFRENRGSYDGLYYLIIALCMLNCILVPVLFRSSKNVPSKKTSTIEGK